MKSMPSQKNSSMTSSAQTNMVPSNRSISRIMLDIVIESRADKTLSLLDRQLRLQIAEDIYGLGTRFMDGKRLTGKLKGYRSWRSGDYRIIYTVQFKESSIKVLRIGHRKDIDRQQRRSLPRTYRETHPISTRTAGIFKANTDASAPSRMPKIIESVREILCDSSELSTIWFPEFVSRISCS